jgi:hypothetical protein
MMPPSWRRPKLRKQVKAEVEAERGSDDSTFLGLNLNLLA